MAVEIERKFLVDGQAWRGEVRESGRMVQGYMRAEDATIRVRIDGPRAYLTIKGRTSGISRGEWEVEFPMADAEELLENFCRPRTIEKVRHYLDVGDHEWTIDEFEGRHAGLVLAEIELTTEDEEFERPHWLGEEVSGDPAYYNSQLARG